MIVHSLSPSKDCYWEIPLVFREHYLETAQSGGGFAVMKKRRESSLAGDSTMP